MLAARSQLTGRIQLYRVQDCFRAASLEFADVGSVVAKFTTPDRQFNWIMFCEALESRSRGYSTLSKAANPVSTTADATSLPPLLRVASSLGSLPGIRSSSRGGLLQSASQQSLLLRSPHPLGVTVPRDAMYQPPRGYSSTASLRPSRSGSSLDPKLMAAKEARLKKIFTVADLKAAECMQRSASKAAAAQMAASRRSQHSLSKPKLRESHSSIRMQDSGREMDSYDAPPTPQPAVAAVDTKAADRQRLRNTSFVRSASDALNSRFSDMFKAFQYVDLDRSGTLNKKELVRALDLWNIPLDEDKLDELIAACDANGDGDVDYKEFVDVLARDTVTLAAMGKRDMQASEAMGVVDLDPEFLGHKKIKNVRASINDKFMGNDTPKAAPTKAAPTPAKQQAAPRTNEQRAADRQKLKSSTFVKSASDALNSRFSDMFKAFQYVDLDRSGTLNKKELVRALDLWNIPLDEDKLDELIAACDANGDGDVDYKEFVDVLARDTVTLAAMGKRDMQASEAMGVVDLDPEFLGHKKIKNVRASINDAYM